MLTGSHAQETGEERSAWQMNDSDKAGEEWFTKSTHQLRQRTDQEGAWVTQPTRETVERIINWFHNYEQEVQH
jgi:hypothetical protein